MEKLKTAQEIHDEFYGSSNPNRYDIVLLMERYALQFKEKPKKTLEDRRWDFKIKFEAIIGHDWCLDKIASEFFEYWTEHGDNGKKMRFEKEKVFDIKKRLERWKRNTKNYGNTKPNTDEAMRDYLNR